MVCYVSEENYSVAHTNKDMISDTESVVMLNSDSESDNEFTSEILKEVKLKLHRIAGGSLIDFAPLFSPPDGEWLFIINRNLVHVYSAATGELIRVLNSDIKKDLIKIEFINSKNIIGCTRKAEIVEWKWKSGAVEYTRKLNFPFKNFELKSFNLLDVSSNVACALITFRVQGTANLQWAITNLENGTILNCPLDLKLNNSKALVMTVRNNFHYFVVAQNSKIHVVNYKNWNYKIFKNANDVYVTCLSNHPSRELFATGDKMGRIFLWPDFWNNDSQEKIKTVLYHWHHTAITSIAFTDSGSGFYSGGEESVLVKWNIEKPELKDYLPRLLAPIKHIAIGPKNKNIAVCTADNGIKILNPQNEVKCVLQNFTYVRDSLNNLDKYGVGLKCNPRNNSIVMNGQSGNLQFFSTYTKSLLYNMDIVGQNHLSEETNRILYNIEVTKVAINIHWMATGEVWDDKEHIPESRLKFWEYKEKHQTYYLNTSIELPHENGFKCIEFSSKYDSDNLLCGTVGGDNQIKIWSLIKSDNIYKKDTLIWCCIAVKSYRNLICNSLSFSEDGSLLAAAFGNNLCILKSDNLKIKVVLTAPSALDGNLKKVEIHVNKVKATNESICHKNKLLEIFKKYLENNTDNSLVNFIQISKSKKDNIEKDITKLKKIEKEILFKHIQSQNEFNLFQKIKIYQRLGIGCKFPLNYKSKIIKYLNKNCLFRDKVESEICHKVLQLNNINRFKAKYRLQKYKNHNLNEDNLIPILSLLNLSDHNENSKSLLNKNEESGHIPEPETEDNNINEDCVDIKHIQFATGECSHLIIASTDHRVLIWNLLTLRIETVLKISVRTIALDPISNLCAAFTYLNELYVFLPSAPLPIYHRFNIPYVYGACWIPRKYPKSQSINVDWQSLSTLYFLTKSQELMVLSRGDKISDNSLSTIFLNEPKQDNQFSIFGAEAINKINSKNFNEIQVNGLIVGKSGKDSIKSVIQMANHTMAPANLLCNNFINSLMITEDKAKRIEQHNNNKINNVKEIL